MTVKQVSGLCLREAGRRFIVSLKASNRYSASCLESLERTIALAAIFRKSAAGRRYGHRSLGRNVRSGLLGNPFRIPFTECLFEPGRLLIAEFRVLRQGRSIRLGGWHNPGQTSVRGQRPERHAQNSFGEVLSALPSGRSAENRLPLSPQGIGVLPISADERFARNPRPWGGIVSHDSRYAESMNHQVYHSGGIVMVQRLSKVDAAKVLQIHHSTIDRMIQRGELQVEREGHGRRAKVWVLLDSVPEGVPIGSPAGSPYSPGGQPVSSSPASSGPPGDVSAGAELAALRERVKGLEQLVEYDRQQLVDADWRYQQLLEQLSSSQRISENLTRSLPAGELTDEPAQRRRWWPFGKS